jgi:hypothetical protein
MKARILLLLLAVFGASLIGCQHSPKTLGDSSLQIPAFSVAVKLSKQAQTRLRDLKESIIVRAYFDGDGEREPGIDTSPMRAVVLGSEEGEVNADLGAEFKGVQTPLSAWKRLSDKNYFVTINTASARKVVADNILWCDDPEKRIEEIKGKTLEVQCELISEHHL